MARGILRCQGLNPLHWQVDSLPPSHQRSPECRIFAQPATQLCSFQNMRVLAFLFFCQAGHLCASPLRAPPQSSGLSEGADCTCHGHRLVPQSPAKRRCWVTVLSAPDWLLPSLVPQFCPVCERPDLPDPHLSAAVEIHAYMYI